ncbi:MAG TPA: zf-HC2 domain-containing protein [Xanthomonadales bacterium]|nr:zf-HC2 domain-containing protein [Xanthomonadales bacterium]
MIKPTDTQAQGSAGQGSQPGEQQLHEWMMAALDGECSAEDRQALEAAMAGDEQLQREWNELQQLKELTRTMSMRKPPDEVWQSYWESVYVRLERGFAWVLVSLGTVVLLAWGIWQGIQAITADTDIPGLIKWAMAVLFIGLAALLVSVVREKMFVRKSDPYKDIQR